MSHILNETEIKSIKLYRQRDEVITFMNKHL